MTFDRQTILSAVLKLSLSDRELLIDEILASMADDGAPSAEWSDVVADRLREIDSGRVQMVPGDEVLGKLRAITHGRAR